MPIVYTRAKIWIAAGIRARLETERNLHEDHTPDQGRPL